MKARLQQAAPYVLVPLVMVGLTFVGLFALDPTGGRAPSFELPIVAGPGAAEGDRISLAELRGQVVVLDFWATWCVPCRQSIPILSRAHERYEAFDVTVLGINAEPELALDRLQAAHHAFGASFSTVQDRNHTLLDAYRVTAFPTLVLIDREGRIDQVITGIPEEAALMAAIDGLLQ